MNYIINPSWFYWINVFENIKDFATVLVIMLLILLAALVVIAAVNYDLGSKFKDDAEWKIYLNYLKIKKIIPKVVIVTLIIGAIAIFLPSKETLISIMVAKYATKENLGMTVEGIKSAVDYIMNAIKEIKG